MARNNPMDNQPKSSLPYLDQFDLLKWREGFTLTLLRLAAVLGIVMIVITFQNTKMVDRFLFIGIYMLLLGVTVLNVPYTSRAIALLIATFAVGMNALINWGPWADGNVFLLATIALSAVLLDQRYDVITLSVCMVSSVTVALSQQLGVYQTGVNVPPLTVWDWVVYLLDFSVVGIILVVALGQFKGTFLRANSATTKLISELEFNKKDLEERVNERAGDLDKRMVQIRTSSSVIRQIAEIKNISELLETTTKLIAEKFGHYHVGLYFLDDQKRSAFLQAASSAAGKQIIGQTYRISPDKRDPFRLVVERNQPIIMTDLDQIHFLRDPNFPLTRSRMILPLTSLGSVIGLLDVHSEQPDVFVYEDAEIMQTLADLTAISFENVRLLDETKSLIEQLEINTSVQTQRTWSKLTSRFKPAYQYTPAGVRPIFTSDKRDTNGALLIPLILHGQKIGSIRLKRKTNASQWSERERNLLEKIADQVSLALENSRLVDEAQKNALRDQLIANISTRIRETLDVDSVVRTTATELRRVFDLKEAEIIVGSTQMDLSNPKDKTA